MYIKLSDHQSTVFAIMNIYEIRENDFKVTLLDIKLALGESTYIMPVSFLSFARKHRWIDHDKNVLTPDILRSGMFSVPRRNNTVLYATYPELLDWWTHLSDESRAKQETLLSAMDDAFVQNN